MNTKRLESISRTLLPFVTRIGKRLAINKWGTARKGVAGDWNNHFTNDVKEQCGEFSINLLTETTDEIEDTWITAESDISL
ncbi:MAG: hypothetical protein ACKVLC_00145 [Phycisphaerales bacterium]|jgi:hypothetical protein|tara:strand:+ start:5839 stop:6081 length:243 start_codon:yes stop_codon:yes gene_type:complete